MARTDFKTPRLFVEAPLQEGASVPLTLEQAHYLAHVLRLDSGARVLVFNGVDGEFAAEIAGLVRKGATLRLGAQTRAQDHAPDIDYLFAPLKHARLDYVAQKAVEMGVRRLRPVITRRTQATRVNLERLRANALEACEQCGIIWVPEVLAEQPLVKCLEDWPAGRLLIFCDEDAPVQDAVAALSSLGAQPSAALLIGPEGGFEEAERKAILAAPSVLRLSLGPRILRADTAAVAALALIQATIGDWPRRSASQGSGEMSRLPPAAILPPC